MTGVSGPASVDVLRDSDLSDADALRASAGWNQQIADWQRMLRLAPDGCFAAKIGGRLVGTVTTIRYGQDLGWIGMMLVHPEFRGRGIARQLMAAAVQWLQAGGVRCIRLDATPAGEPVYLRMGFLPEWTFWRWQRAAAPAVIKADSEFGRGTAHSSRASQLAHTTALSAPGLELDREAFGTNRSALLQLLAADCRICLQAVDAETPAERGFGMLRSGRRADYLGPVTAGSPALGRQLTAELLRQAEGVVFWDVPELNPEAVALAEQHGLQRLRPLTRMRLGPAELQPHWPLQYAIADPAWG